MKIAVFTTMPKSNIYTGNLGITYFMISLLNKLIEENHEVKFCGKLVENYNNNIFCDIMNLKPYNLEFDNKIQITTDVNDCDILFIYNRPDTITSEFSLQNNFAKQFIDMNKEVYILCCYMRCTGTWRRIVISSTAS